MSIIYKTLKNVTVCCSGTRVTPIYIGARYVCEPLNPLKLKNRGRTGVLLEFCESSDGIGLALWEGNIKWEDTKRISKIDISEFVLLEM